MSAMYPLYTHIVDYIRNVAHEVASTATSSIRGMVKKLRNTHLRFTGGITSDKTTIDNLTDTTISVKIDPTKHHHTAVQFKDGVVADPDTIVKRDTKGNIISSGTEYGNTGYILANSQDISTIFLGRDDTVMSIQHINVNRGNALVDLKIEKVGSTLKVTRTYGTVCVCYTK